MRFPPRLRRTALLLLPALLLPALFLAACGPDGDAPAPADAPGADDAPLVIEGAWARPAGAGGTSAAYLTVVNPSAAADSLVGAATDAAGLVELHETVERDGLRGMRPVAAAPVPPGGALQLAPGGLHVMLMQLPAPLAAGDTLALTLRFARGAAQTVAVPVRADAPAL